MKKIRKPKFFLFAICLFLTVAFLFPYGLISAEQPEEDWVAYPMHIGPLSEGTSHPHGLEPDQIRTAYNLPSEGGAGTIIAIVDAYDTPNVLNDFNSFSHEYNLPDNNTGNLIVYKMPGTIETDTGWGQETCLDVEWAHAIAPNATIILVEAVDNQGHSLYDAVDFASSIPDVVAVSMSWGGPEYDHEVYRDNHFIEPGVVFFAASGDNKTAVYPATSPNVVAVGGTKLTFNEDGTFASETGWSLSGGGPSLYENSPDYQKEYGLTNPMRCVPDVSYNADPNSGVSVCYNGSWYIIGGTSAGAPQWAAIHALGLTSTNNNLYQKAKSAYSSYFRDITSGSNDYDATPGYDYVTGLGSPLAFKFGTSFEVSPTSGPGNGTITLRGTGFTAQGSVNISYLNPINSTWTPIINDLQTVTENFIYTLTAPELAQNNVEGDSSALFDNIIFSAQDNNTSRSYNSTTPYMEMRRGLSQIGNATAQGIFGNNTDLSTILFVQNADLIPVSGKWFNPGLVSLWWDTTSLGTTAADENGFFNTTIQVPQTTAGSHCLKVYDDTTVFSLNLTRLPTLINDYVEGWHTSDFTINLTPDYNVNETFYRINDGQIQNITTNDQPTITIEGKNITIEYWSSWNPYGQETLELLHYTLSGIQLDKTAPTGSVTADPTTEVPEITLSLSATDATSGIFQMRFSNDNSTWSDWEPYTTSKTWNLQGADGQKTVIVQFKDNAGLVSPNSCIVTLQSLQPMSSPTPTSTETPSFTPTETPLPTSPTQIPPPTQTGYPKSSPEPTNILEPTLSPLQTINPSPDDSQTSEPPAVPEIPTFIFIAIALSILTIAIIQVKKKIKN